MAISTPRRNRLPRSAFALPGQRKYPIDTKARARNALARAAQSGTASNYRTVRAKVTKKYPSLKKTNATTSSSSTSGRRSRSSSRSSNRSSKRTSRRQR